MNDKLRAWHVWSGHPQDGSLLIFARSQAKAKNMGYRAGLWDWEYLEIRARRCVKWDVSVDIERVIEKNEDIRVGPKDFYADEY